MKGLLIIRVRMSIHSTKKYEPFHEKNRPMPYANNKSADSPAHPHSLMSTFVVHCRDSTIHIGLFRLHDFFRTTLSCMILSCMIFLFTLALQNHVRFLFPPLYLRKENGER